MKLWKLFGGNNPRNRNNSKRPLNRKTRLELECLEERAVPTGNASGVINGTAFLDSNGSGVFDAGESVVRGAPAVLTGTTNQGQAVNVTATTNANGTYSFDNVLPGTYQISAGALQNLIPSGTTVFTGLVITTNQTLTQNFSYRALSETGISMRLFLTSTTTADLPFPTAGSGTGVGNFRPNNLPVVETVLPNLNVAQSGTTSPIDLAGFFDDQDFTNSQVRLETSEGNINFELFDRQAARTVANFFNYIESNKYDKSIFHRLAFNGATPFVLQGGGFTFQPNPSQLVNVPEDPTVQNEFATSNSLGTVAMAKLPSDPNSASSEFFVNLGNNGGTSPNGLDFQNGGFTVFGRLASAADQTIVNNIVAIGSQDVTNGDILSPFDDVPLKNYTGAAAGFPGNTTEANFVVVNDVVVVKRDEFLTYSVVNNSNSGLVAATITNNRLGLVITPNQTGNSSITVRATDRYGSFVEDTFIVTVA